MYAHIDLGLSTFRLKNNVDPNKFCKLLGEYMIERYLNIKSKWNDGYLGYFIHAIKDNLVLDEPTKEEFDILFDQLSTVNLRGKLKYNIKVNAHNETLLDIDGMNWAYNLCMINDNLRYEIKKT